ncbi:Uncharacterised protein [Segatella copri]|nr:Uncharacterised protein [Segatella copri]
MISFCLVNHSWSFLTSTSISFANSFKLMSAFVAIRFSY